MQILTRVTSTIVTAALCGLFLLAPVGSASAQGTLAAKPKATAARTATAAAAVDPLSALPASDAVLFMDMNRVVTEILPRVLANNPTKLAQVNSEIDSFRTRFGIDPRSFSRVAVGVRFVEPAPGITKTEMVAVVSGRFDPKAIIAAGRLAAKGKYAEQRYAGKTMYVFTLDEQIKLLGLLPARVGEIAVVALDNNMLALGTPENVRLALDASASNARGAARNAELVALSTRIPNAVFGFGGNVPQKAIANIDFGNDEIKRNLQSIRQVYGALNTTANGYEMLTTARTTDVTTARNLNDTIEGLKSLGQMFAGGMPGDRGRLARAAVNGLTVNTQGTDVGFRLALSDADVALLIGMFEQRQK